MDVARIAYIINLERGYGFYKEIIYAAAFLHDITKWRQHLEGVPHNESAIKPAEEILRDCNFSAVETQMICNTILHHRKGPKDDDIFSALIFQADKLSRACFSCAYEAACDWDACQKNLLLGY